MYDLYTWTTPNGRKVSILLEELEVPYEVRPINIGQGEQKTPEYLAINPNNKIPSIVVQETGRAIIESGAIMLFLAETHGRFISADPDERLRTIEWLMWQMGGFGPILGQTHHHVHFNRGKAPYTEERMLAETRRLYAVLDSRLDGRDYIASDYSIADIACWPWVSRFEWQEIDLNDYSNVRDWYVRIAQRPAVQRGYDVPKKVADIPLP